MTRGERNTSNRRVTKSFVFWNNEVIGNMEGVILAVMNALVELILYCGEQHCVAAYLDDKKLSEHLEMRQSYGTRLLQTRSSGG